MKSGCPRSVEERGTQVRVGEVAPRGAITRLERVQVIWHGLESCYLEARRAPRSFMIQPQNSYQGVGDLPTGSVKLQCSCGRRKLRQRRMAPAIPRWSGPINPNSSAAF